MKPPGPFLLLAAALALIALAAAHAHAQVSDAQKAWVMWSAFECSAFAEKSKDPQQQRLFQLGYEQGKQFLKAVEEGRISPKEQNSQIPLIVLLLLQGPSHDFIIGRVFENAVKSARDKMDKDLSPALRSDEELLFSAAGREYNRANCMLLGR